MITLKRHPNSASARHVTADSAWRSLPRVVLQVFRGVHWSDDVLNHENVGFWHYLQPAYSVMGFISCAGTNFLIRSSAFAQAGDCQCRLLPLELPGSAAAAQHCHQ